MPHLDTRGLFKELLEGSHAPSPLLLLLLPLLAVPLLHELCVQLLSLPVICQCLCTASQRMDCIILGAAEPCLYTISTEDFDGQYLSLARE